MKRRDFLKTGASGLAASAGVLALPGIAYAEARPPAERRIDPEALAAAAHSHFMPGKRTCGEAILMAGCQVLDVKSRIASDTALGLAGGVGLQGQTCAVITGAALVLALAAAEKQPDYAKRKMPLFEAVQRLSQAFEKQFGASDCRTLSGLDLTTAEGRKTLKATVKA